jgi:hypothetical protein
MKGESTVGHTCATWLLTFRQRKPRGGDVPEPSPLGNLLLDDSLDIGTLLDEAIPTIEHATPLKDADTGDPLVDGAGEPVRRVTVSFDGVHPTPGPNDERACFVKHHEFDVKAPIHKPDGTVVLRELPDAQILRAGVLFRWHGDDARQLAVTVHIPHGKGVKTAVVRSIARYAQEAYKLTVSSEALVEEEAVVAAIENDAIQNVRLTRVSPRRDQFGVERWVDDGDVGSITIEYSPPKGKLLSSQWIKQFIHRGGDAAEDGPATFAAFARIGDEADDGEIATFDQVDVQVNVADKGRRTLRIREWEEGVGHAFRYVLPIPDDPTDAQVINALRTEGAGL